MCTPDYWCAARAQRRKKSSIDSQLLLLLAFVPLWGCRTSASLGGEGYVGCLRTGDSAFNMDGYGYCYCKSSLTFSIYEIKVFCNLNVAAHKSITVAGANHSTLLIFSSHFPRLLPIRNKTRQRNESRRCLFRGNLIEYVVTHHTKKKKKGWRNATQTWTD